MFDSDVNLFYSGGSGGFYFLHCLLMYQRHCCRFPTEISYDYHPGLRLSESSYNNIKDPSWPDYSYYLLHGSLDNIELQNAEIKWAVNPEIVPGWFDRVFDSVHQHNWNINTKQWKSTEIWPINYGTLDTSCDRRPYKIFFTCNDIESWMQWPGKKVVLYTDIRTQTRLAMYKKAWKYINPDRTYTKTKNGLRSARNYQGLMVGETAALALDQADHAISLQDFVKTMLGIEATKAQRDFTKFWLSQHPTELLHRCNLI
jgi:hypothetical protein